MLKLRMFYSRLWWEAELDSLHRNQNAAARQAAARVTTLLAIAFLTLGFVQMLARGLP